MKSLLSIILSILLFVPAVSRASVVPLAEAEVVTAIEYSETSTATVANFNVSTNGVLLNVYEVTLLFNPNEVQIVDVHIESALCESRLIIENTINTETGEVHVACGTVTPFSNESTFAPVLEVTFTTTEPSTEEVFQLGGKTNFYQHDGQGTLATRAERPVSVAL